MQCIYMHRKREEEGRQSMPPLFFMSAPEKSYFLISYFLLSLRRTPRRKGAGHRK